jgi:hypothetical protein
MLEEAKSEGEKLGEARMDGDMLEVGVAVPSQIHTLSAGAPQDRRQQSRGQAVPEGDGETLAVCVGAVCEAVAVTHRQIVLGQAPEHCQLPPTHGETEGDTVVLVDCDAVWLRDGLVLGVIEGDTLIVRATEGETLDEENMEDETLGEAVTDGDSLEVGVGVPLQVH